MKMPLWIVVVVTLVAGCDAASGTSSLLQVEAAQFRDQPVALDGTAGPMVVSLTSQRSEVVLGSNDQRFRAALGVGSTAMQIGIDGEPTSWLIPAGVPEFDTPDLPSASARFGVQLSAVPGTVALVAVAVSANGEVGPARQLELLLIPAPVPTGNLVVSLQWTSAADLDLHVIDPNGGEAWSGDPNTYQAPPPGQPADPDGFRNGGILDHDGNAGCHRDGRATENIVWQRMPPVGRYTVRVDTRSLCGDASANWQILVKRDDALIAQASGRSVPADELQPHRAGAGVLVLTFDVP
jgi:hypothetical protein